MTGKGEIGELGPSVLTAEDVLDFTRILLQVHDVPADAPRKSRKRIGPSAFLALRSCSRKSLPCLRRLA